LKPLLDLAGGNDWRIVLTLRHRVGIKRQVVADQVARGPATAVALIKVASGTAVVPPPRNMCRDG